MYIPFILSGSPNECLLLTCDACVITNWRLVLRAPLVARTNYYTITHDRSPCAWSLSLLLSPLIFRSKWSLHTVISSWRDIRFPFPPEMEMLKTKPTHNPIFVKISCMSFLGRETGSHLYVRSWFGTNSHSNDWRRCLARSCKYIIKKQARFILWLCIDSVMNLVKPLDLFDEFDEFSHILPDLQPLFL